jgi:hypothetical protein
VGCGGQLVPCYRHRNCIQPIHQPSEVLCCAVLYRVLWCPGPLVFLLLGLGAYFGYTRGSLTGRQQAKGRWVYDRSLGGKKVRCLTLWAVFFPGYRGAHPSPAGWAVLLHTFCSEWQSALNA